MVPVDSVGVPRDPTYSGTPRETKCFHVRDCHPLWSAFPDRSVSTPFSHSHVRGPTTPQRKSPRFGLLPVRSPLLRKSIFLSFPAVTEMFQFTALAARTYEFSACQFGNLGINTRLTVPPSFSQFSTPFKAS